MNTTQPWHDSALRFTRLDAVRDATIAAFEEEFIRRWNAAYAAVPSLSENYQVLTSPIFYSAQVHKVPPPSSAKITEVKSVAPLIQKELSQTPSPNEKWYEDKLFDASFYFYLENQYLYDDRIVDNMILDYLDHEDPGMPHLLAGINLCCPQIVDPKLLYALSNMLAATKIRLSTAERIMVAGKLIERPRGGWKSVSFDISNAAKLAKVVGLSAAGAGVATALMPMLAPLAQVVGAIGGAIRRLASFLIQRHLVSERRRKHAYV